MIDGKKMACIVLTYDSEGDTLRPRGRGAEVNFTPVAALVPPTRVRQHEVGGFRASVEPRPPSRLPRSIIPPPARADPCAARAGGGCGCGGGVGL